jgi:hypothetical protein
MPHQCIKYRLTEQGTIPDFICFHEESLSGRYPVDTGTHESPRQILLVGISEQDVTGDFEVIPTKADLLAYLNSVCSGWEVSDPDGKTVGGMPAMKPFDATSATDFFWGKLDALNAA